MVCQRVKTDRRYEQSATQPATNPTKTKRTSGGAFVLDDPTPYGARVVNIADSEQKTIERDDSPSEPLRLFTKVSCSDSFETYLMYQPAGADSIPVTLRVLTWSWGGTATLDAGVWRVTDGTPAATTQPVGSQDSTTLPEWSDYVSNLKRVPDPQ
jgi:hypothetical protein